MITAHGASDRQKQAWLRQGFSVTDTTCPLVHKAHQALAELVGRGFHPVVIGQAGHAEVRGLVGDFSEANVVEKVPDVLGLPYATHYGVVAQTTQPLEHVLDMVRAMKAAFPNSGVHFRDTVCHPTKQRQQAMEDLCRRNEVIVVVGGKNSNNSRQLLEKAQRAGCAAYLVETAAELSPAWFAGRERIGITAGTSTLRETVAEVVATLERWVA
jgi:4-hydroxy-3-methylbut-2-enyl diphosphate reductase